jgi:hypothetical protein
MDGGGGRGERASVGMCVCVCEGGREGGREGRREGGRERDSHPLPLRA